MATENPTPGRCNAPAWLNEAEREADGTSKTGHCEKYPVKSDDSDTCRMHFGTADAEGIRGDGAGAPVGNGNGITHGATASPLNLKDHLGDEARRWVDSLVAGYLEVAPFGFEDPRRERLSKTCVMIYQEWRAAEVVMSEGASEEVTVAVSESGYEATKQQEHHLAKRERALNDKVRMNLKDLGVQPSGGETGGDTVAQIFEAAVERAKREEGDDEPETVEAEEVES